MASPRVFADAPARRAAAEEGKRKRLDELRAADLTVCAWDGWWRLASGVEVIATKVHSPTIDAGIELTATRNWVCEVLGARVDLVRLRGESYQVRVR